MQTTPQQKQYMRDYYKSNRQKLLERSKNRYESNKVEITKYKKEYAKRNKDRIKQWHYNWRKTANGAYNSIKRSSRVFDRELLPLKDFVVWFESQEMVCIYCKQTMEEILASSDSYNKTAFRLTIDRMDSGEGYIMGNLALACFRCNTIKSDFFTHEQMLTVGKMVKERRIELCERLS